MLMASLQVCAGLLALKDNCLHPTTQKPYILSATGGKNNSPEGLDVRLSPRSDLKLTNHCQQKKY